MVLSFIEFGVGVALIYVSSAGNTSFILTLSRSIFPVFVTLILNSTFSPVLTVTCSTQFPQGCLFTFFCIFRLYWLFPLMVILAESFL